LIVGDYFMGHLVMRRAAALAIEKAKATGVGWIGARMSNHAGPAALYVTMPLEHDMVGLYFAVGSNNHLPPWGGSESLLGTNPIARMAFRCRKRCATLSMRWRASLRWRGCPSLPRPIHAPFLCRRFDPSERSFEPVAESQ